MGQLRLSNLLIILGVAATLAACSCGGKSPDEEGDNDTRLSGRRSLDDPTDDDDDDDDPPPDPPPVTAQDSDGDGIPDGSDPCPSDPANGCAAAADTDGDGILNRTDNCPAVANADQADGDGDRMGDACDPCPGESVNDPDGDGLCASVDNCPTTANADQADGDGDGAGDLCDACPADADNDLDDDGVCGDTDNCPADANPGQADFNDNARGDVCEDTDGDTVVDADDECPNHAEDDPDGDGECGWPNYQFAFVSDREGVENLYLSTTLSPDEVIPLTDHGPGESRRILSPDFSPDGSRILFNEREPNEGGPGWDGSTARLHVLEIDGLVEDIWGDVLEDDGGSERYRVIEHATWQGSNRIAMTALYWEPVAGRPAHETVWAFNSDGTTGGTDSVLYSTAEGGLSLSGYNEDLYLGKIDWFPFQPGDPIEVTTRMAIQMNRPGEATGYDIFVGSYYQVGRAGAPATIGSMTPTIQTHWHEKDPAFSPDGARLAYVSSEGGGGISLCSLDFGGLGESATCDDATTLIGNAGSGLTSFNNPCWIRDGGGLLFSAKQDGVYDIFSIRPDGTGLVNLTNDPATGTDDGFADYRPACSPVAPRP